MVTSLDDLIGEDSRNLHDTIYLEVSAELHTFRRLPRADVPADMQDCFTTVYQHVTQPEVSLVVLMRVMGDLAHVMQADVYLGDAPVPAEDLARVLHDERPQ